MFDSEVQRILDFVARGIGVRVVGATGSGKTAVVKSVIANLEKTGVSVHFISGLRTHRSIPYSAIKGLGLDMRPGRSGVFDVADVFASQLATPGKHLIVADDIHLVDNESLAVLEAVRRRSDCPMVATAPETWAFSKGQLAVLNQGREAHLQLDPLHYEQVHMLIAQVLGAPADAEATARILTKSAGNPRLIVRIAETASLSELLVLRDKQWRMTGSSLWNEHLRGTLEALLAEVTTEEFTALHIMAILGTARIDILQKVITPEILENLERRGFLSVMTDHHSGSIAAISPPVIADHFRGQEMLRDRHLLRSKIAGMLETAPQTATENSSTPDCLAQLLAELRLEKGDDDAVTARHFHDHNASRERTRFERWEGNKTAANAVALLRTYWGAPVNIERAARVCAETTTADAETTDLLFLTITKAMLAIQTGQGPSAAVEILQSLSAAQPKYEAEVADAVLFLSASHGRVQPTEPLLAGADAHGGMRNLVCGLLELYRLQPEAALEAVEGEGDEDAFPHLRPFIRGFAMFAAGRVDESLVFALDWRAEARKNLDQFGVVTSSYIAAHGLLYRGNFEEAEYLMSSVFAMGRPGFVVDSLYDAMLRLAGLRHATNVVSPAFSIAAQARDDVHDVGPLPGIGKGAYELIAHSSAQPATFDRKAAKLVKRQLKSGYVLEAMMTALLCTCLCPGKPVLDLLQKILRESGISVHNNFLAIAAAVVEGDHQLLGLLLKHYEPDTDTYQIGMLLRGALKRHVVEGDGVAADALAQASWMFAVRFPSANEQLSFNAFRTTPLTEREIEVAVLAGHRSNVEIGEHLGISARTVENHISNALRKTGATSRNSLFMLVGNSLPPR
ncbi:LuxR C-terminal-related transcriptional regulator [Arthrobacter sp. AK01]|uniref:LuxR family transcriptional regulator n=1 Tax=Arthrobacter sp. AK01 TaxID=2894084 RepID=UPI001E3237C4|nr:LuxR family transcriptional regulator [Arthrobacter sp. AK01]MCD4852415.1 LuxR C-terminal-related transcriptional regulator [Arthrobacter sp. AK01]